MRDSESFYRLDRNGDLILILLRGPPARAVLGEDAPAHRGSKHITPFFLCCPLSLPLLPTCLSLSCRSALNAPRLSSYGLYFSICHRVGRHISCISLCCVWSRARILRVVCEGGEQNSQPMAPAHYRASALSSLFHCTFLASAPDQTFTYSSLQHIHTTCTPSHTQTGAALRSPRLCVGGA